MPPEQAELLIEFLIEQQKEVFPCTIKSATGEFIRLMLNGVEIKVTDEKTDQDMVVSIYSDRTENLYFCLCPIADPSKSMPIISIRSTGLNGKDYMYHLHTRTSLWNRLRSVTCKARFFANDDETSVLAYIPFPNSC